MSTQDEPTTETEDETTYAAKVNPLEGTEGTPDEVGPAAEVVPGVGPTPEPEPEGFREEIMAKDEERRQRIADETKERSDKAKEYLSGGAAREGEGEGEESPTS